MAFIHTVPLDEAIGPLKEMYDAELRESGIVDHAAQAFSLRPGAYKAWENLIIGIRSNMDLRRYELVTIAAATKLRCSY